MDKSAKFVKYKSPNLFKSGLTPSTSIEHKPAIIVPPLPKKKVKKKHRVMTAINNGDAKNLDENFEKSRIGRITEMLGYEKYLKPRYTNKTFFASLPEKKGKTFKYADYTYHDFEEKDNVLKSGFFIEKDQHKIYVIWPNKKFTEGLDLYDNDLKEIKGATKPYDFKVVSYQGEEQIRKNYYEFKGTRTMPREGADSFDIALYVSGNELRLMQDCRDEYEAAQEENRKSEKNSFLCFVSGANTAQPQFRLFKNPAPMIEDNICNVIARLKIKS